MGTGPSRKKHGARSKNKHLKRKHSLKHRTRDVDQIYEAKRKRASAAAAPVEYDDELPGGGQFYCVETDRHFISAQALAEHKRTKFYKKRIKELKKEPYTQDTADWAAGKTREVLPPASMKK
jgi:bud site selection protein 20